MLYTIAIQNLRLQVSVPDSTDTAALDKVVREFNAVSYTHLRAHET